jgi:hypothetical protein
MGNVFIASAWPLGGRCPAWPFSLDHNPVFQPAGDAGVGRWCRLVWGEILAARVGFELPKDHSNLQVTDSALPAKPTLPPMPPTITRCCTLRTLREPPRANDVWMNSPSAHNARRRVAPKVDQRSAIADGLRTLTVSSPAFRPEPTRKAVWHRRK